MQILEYLGKSHGIQRTTELAVKHASLAAAAIDSLPETRDVDATNARTALVHITQKIITRNKWIIQSGYFTFVLPIHHLLFFFLLLFLSEIITMWRISLLHFFLIIGMLFHHPKSRIYFLFIYFNSKIECFEFAEVWTTSRVLLLVLWVLNFVVKKFVKPIFKN